MKNRNALSWRTAGWAWLAAALVAALPLAPRHCRAEDAKPEGAEKPGAADETERLLAERERQRGPTFPGRDPAFLVLPRPSERTRMAEELLTPRVKERIEKALNFLVLAQDADGGWSDKEFPSDTGVAGLCSLAFMAEGSRPGIGRYGRPLQKGLTYLLNNVSSSGIIVGKQAYEFGPMYEHMYATLALLLSYGEMPDEPRARRILERAVEVLQKSQKRDGGWRYLYSSEGQSDISVTANALWVLRTAKKSGFTVAPQSVERGVKYIEQCAMPDGTFRYRYWGLHANPSMGGTGIMALCNNGSLDHPLIVPARDRIDYDYKRFTVADFLGREYFIYGCFFASLAQYSSGDDYFIPLYGKLIQILDAAGRKDGEYPDHKGNTVYVTAMAAILMQAPYGYLPIYER
jgi:hypothetical protein